MSKYADIEQIKKVIRDEWIKYIPMEFDMNIAFVLGKIAEVPTIDIVRCKDCKFINNSQRVTKPDGSKMRYKCDCIGVYVFAHDFCSYGERMESDGE